MSTTHAKNIGKVVIVLLAAVLIWASSTQLRRELTPLEQEVQSELHAETVPERYSDGSVSVIGLQKQMSLASATSGDAFMVRGVVQLTANLDSNPEIWYVLLGDRRSSEESVAIWIKPEEAQLFKEGRSVALQIRLVSEQMGSGYGFRIETF